MSQKMIRFGKQICCVLSQLQIEVQRSKARSSSIEKKTNGQQLLNLKLNKEFTHLVLITIFIYASYS